MRPYRFSDAVRGLGTTDGTVRQWLDSGKVTIERGYGEGWAEFTLHDIAVLAVTHKLVEFGIPVAAAFKIASHAIDLGRKHLRGKRFAHIGEHLIAGWKGMLMTVQRDRKNPKDWKVARWKSDENEAPAFGSFVCIDVATIVTEAFDRVHPGIVEPASPPDKKARSA